MILLYLEITDVWDFSSLPRHQGHRCPERVTLKFQKSSSTPLYTPASPHSVTVDGTHNAAWHTALNLVSLHTSKTTFSSYTSHKNLPSVSRAWQRPWLTQIWPCSVCALDDWPYFRMGEQAVTTFFYGGGHRRGRELTECGHRLNELGAGVRGLHREVGELMIFAELKK